MKAAIKRYVHENYDDLLKLDLKIARILGAPAPHTLSSWAYLKSRFWTKVINRIMKWLFNESNHCYKEYRKVDGS